MTNKTRTLFIVCFINMFILFCRQSLLAQPKIIFNQPSFDFGDITEGTMATYEFTFINKGTEPLIVSQVNPSCGCTVPEWSKVPVKPGDIGKIKATYNTNGRPGSFVKSIGVVSNAETPNQTLIIKGVVISAPKGNSITDELIKTSPKIIIEKETYTFGKVERNSRLVLKVSVKNLGRSDLIIDQVNSSCNCVHVIQKPAYIASGKTEVLELAYSPIGIDKVEDRIYIKSNDLIKPQYTIVTQSEVVESLVQKSIIQQNTQSIPFK